MYLCVICSKKECFSRILIASVFAFPYFPGRLPIRMSFKIDLIDNKSRIVIPVNGRK